MHFMRTDIETHPKVYTDRYHNRSFSLRVSRKYAVQSYGGIDDLLMTFVFLDMFTRHKLSGRANTRELISLPCCC